MSGIYHLITLGNVVFSLRADEKYWKEGKATVDKKPVENGFLQSRQKRFVQTAADGKRDQPSSTVLYPFQFSLSTFFGGLLFICALRTTEFVRDIFIFYMCWFNRPFTCSAFAPICLSKQPEASICSQRSSNRCNQDQRKKEKEKKLHL